MSQSRSQSHEPVSAAHAVFRYSILGLPIAFAGIPIYLYAPDMYASTGAISLSLLGVLLMVLRLIDAVLDPWIGVFLDRYRHRASALTLLSAGLLLSGFFALFQPPSSAVAVWFFVAMFVVTLGYSLMLIQLNSLSARATPDPQRQLALNAWREFCVLAGLMLAVTLPWLFEFQLSLSQPFTWLGLVLALILVVALGVHLPWLRQLVRTGVLEPNFDSGSTHPANVERKVFFVFSPNWRGFYAVYAMSTLASSIPAVLLVFYARDLLNAESQTGAFLFTYFFFAACSIPVWRWMSSRIGLLASWRYGMGMAVVSFFWATFLRGGDSTVFLSICAISGFALGADLAIPPTLMARRLTRLGRDAIYAQSYAWYAFVNKACLAIAAGVSFPLLSLSGFVPNQPNTPQAIVALAVAYAGIPCGIKLLAFLCSYQIGRQDEIVNSTNYRRSARGSTFLT